MNPKLLAHVQAVAFHLIVWRGPITKLVEFISYSMKKAAPPSGEIERQLRREDFQRALVAYDVALWQGTDKQFRIVSLAVPTDPAQARARAERFPASRGTSCRWCWQDEGRLADIELVPELSVGRDPVAGSYIHPACQRAWMRLRACAEQEALHG